MFGFGTKQFASGCAVALAGSALVATVPSSATTSSVVKKVATAKAPIGLVRHPVTKTVYVIEQGGTLRELPLRLGRVVKAGKIVLNLSSQVSKGNEQGLLGAAFSPDGKSLYTNHTNRDGDTEINQWPMQNGIVNTSRRTLLLNVSQPYSNHNGGNLLVTRDGVLWIGVGDGGSGGDPKGNGQKLDTLLGKILRIIPTPNANKPYEIPPGNLAPSRGRPEIWAYGLRNPWGFAVDHESGRVWIADVGQNSREEVNLIPIDTPTANFGWNKREGTRAYEDGQKPEGAIDPIYDYAHGSDAMEGCSVTGGVVRKRDGAFIFSDYCQGSLRAASTDGTVSRIGGSVKLKSVSAFGYDAMDNILVVSRDGAIYRLRS